MGSVFAVEFGVWAVLMQNSDPKTFAAVSLISLLFMSLLGIGGIFEGRKPKGPKRAFSTGLGALIGVAVIIFGRAIWAFF